MSAINEALKKARQQSPETVTGNNGNYLMPGDRSSAHTAHWSRPLPWAALLMFAMGVLLMKEFVLRTASDSASSSFESRQAQPSVASIPTVETDSASEAAAVVMIESENSSASQSNSELGTSRTATDTPAETATDGVVATSSPSDGYPSLRLQGIFFRKDAPYVVINAKTLTVGDQVEGVTIQTITRDSVVLHWRGQIKTLTLR